jgi:hypothetical protein
MGQSSTARRNRFMMLTHRTFTTIDQMRFASVSGDCNPMHVDALQARRTQAGAPVVHGVNLLLWAFDSLAASQPNLPPLRGFEAQFYNFVYLHETVQLELIEQGPEGMRLHISVDHVPRSKVTIEFGEPVQETPALCGTSLEQINLSSAPATQDFGQSSGRSGRFAFAMTQEDAKALFPDATKWVGAALICAAAATSYLVGMVCPGLYSTYRDLSVKTCPAADVGEQLAFRVTKTDGRFHMVEQEIFGGGLTGTIRSFFRTPPVRQATMESLLGVVGPTKFAGSVALIVGGSRGLGELTAKLIAAGGGHAVVTWQNGRDDAERVAQEIRSAGGTCATLNYDSRRPAFEQLASMAEVPTHAYYFATPAIFRPQSEFFSSERLTEFLAVYVDGFWNLSQELRSRNTTISLFYPSSVAVTDKPRGMMEYTMAKAAGELLCTYMNVSLAPMRVIVKRLPRLPTDQTSSNTGAKASSPLETMLPIIQEMQAQPS